MNQKPRMETKRFVRGLMAKLGSGGVEVIRLHQRPTRIAQQAIADYFVEEVKKEGPKNAEMQNNRFMKLVYIRNSLLPSNTGWFDSFNNIIKGLNPLARTNHEEEVIFNCSQQYYKPIFDEYTPEEKILIEKTAAIYLSTLSP